MRGRTRCADTYSPARREPCFFRGVGMRLQRAGSQTGSAQCTPVSSTEPAGLCGQPLVKRTLARTGIAVAGGTSSMSTGSLPALQDGQRGPPRRNTATSLCRNCSLLTPAAVVSSRTASLCSASARRRPRWVPLGRVASGALHPTLAPPPFPRRGICLSRGSVNT